MIVDHYTSAWGSTPNMYLLREDGRSVGVRDAHKLACHAQGRTPVDDLLEWGREHYPGEDYDILTSNGAFECPHILEICGGDMRLDGEKSSTWVLSPHISKFEIAICLPSSVDKISTSWIINDSVDPHSTNHYTVHQSSPPIAHALLFDLGVATISDHVFATEAILRTDIPKHAVIIKQLAKMNIEPSQVTRSITFKEYYEMFHPRLWSELFSVNCYGDIRDSVNSVGVVGDVWFAKS